MVVPLEPPPPELVDPEALQALVEGLIGALSFLLKPIIGGLVRAFKWVYHEYFIGQAVVMRDLSAVSVAAAGRLDALQAGIHALESRTATTVNNTVVNVVGATDAKVQEVIAFAQAVGQEVLHDAESLYNQSVTHADAVGQEVLHDAESLYNQSVAHADTVGAELLGDAQSLYNQAVTYAATVGAEVLGNAQALYNQAVGYADALVRPIEGEVLDVRKWAEAALAALGVDVFARVITAVQAMYDECCAFSTDEVKPAWDRVKGMLGKMTRRGPLAIVVMGAAAEVVVSWDRLVIVAMLKQAQANRPPADRAAMHDWARLN